MRRSEAFGIPGVDTSNAPNFSGRQLGTIVKTINQAGALPVDTVDQFLEADFGERQSGRSRAIVTAISALFAASAVGSEFALTEDSARADAIPLPSVVNGAIDALRVVPGLSDAFYPGADGLVGHMPMLGLAAAGLTGIASGLVGYGRNMRNRRDDQAQTALRKRVEAGEASFDLSQDTAAVSFVGNGSTFAAEIARHLRTVQIGYKPVDGIYVHLDKDATADQAREAYERADVAHADQILVLPAVVGRALFPPVDYDPSANDYGVDRFTTMTDRAHHMWNERMEGPMIRNITVIGDENQLTISAEATVDGRIRSADKSQTPMWRRVDQLRQHYGDHIEVIDPSRLVVAALHERAPEQPFRLVSNLAGLNAFLPRFTMLTEERPEVDPKSDSCRVICYPDDRSTVASLAQVGELRESDLAILREPSRVSDLTELGMTPDRIVVATDEILSALIKLPVPQLPLLAGSTAGELR